MKKVLFLILSMLSVNAFSSEMADLNCASKEIKAEGLRLLLNTKTAATQIYVFKNKTQNELELNHIKKGGMGAGWASSLASGNWSALMVTEKNFNLTCATKGKAISCKKALQICQTKKTRIKADGSYWIFENQGWKEAAEGLEAKNK